MKRDTKTAKVKYSVLLLYPDYIANDFGSDTYYTFVVAATPREALDKARQSCLKVCPDINDPVDLFCLLLIHGHKHDMASVAQEE